VIESQRVHGIRMSCSCFGRLGVRGSYIDNLESQIIRDGSNQGFVNGVVLDVVDNGAVVGVCSIWFDDVAICFDRIEIPKKLATPPH